MNIELLFALLSLGLDPESIDWQVATLSDTAVPDGNGQVEDGAAYDFVTVHGFTEAESEVLTRNARGLVAAYRPVIPEGTTV
jgi:hypothetical protein